MPQPKTSKMNQNEVDTIRIKKRESTKKSKDRKRIKKKQPQNKQVSFYEIAMDQKKITHDQQANFFRFHDKQLACL